MGERREDTTAERDEMLAAVRAAHLNLLRYGEHDGSCDAMHDGGPCDCGFDVAVEDAQDAARKFSVPARAALAAAEQERGEKDAELASTAQRLEASAADWEREVETLYPKSSGDGADMFARWFCQNYPAPSVISDPSWHAGKIYRAALAAAWCATTALTRRAARANGLLAELARLVDMYDVLTVCEDAHGVGIYHGEDRIAYGADMQTALADSRDQWKLARAIVGRNHDAL